MTHEKPKRKAHSRTLKAKKTEDRYEKDYSWSASSLSRAEDVRTTTELVAFLESDAGKNIEVEARVLSYHEGQVGFRKFTKKKFIESFRENNGKRSLRSFKESFNGFSGSGGNGFSSGGNNFVGTVGNDFTPLLGGPFYKQLYYYNDWLKMHQDCFYAYHHDPYAKSSIAILVNFVLGKGYRLQCKSQIAQAIWGAFEVANDFKTQFRDFVTELYVYGENMIWWLPDNNAVIDFNKFAQGKIPKALLPRVRLIDPSNIVEIITHPEDITRKIAYVWLTPTQYQIYTAKDNKTGEVVNSTKFIYQHIPAEEMMHYKVNAVSNEKRGRSELFAGLPYFKRLRDTANYQIIAEQKNAAWAIDTTVDGSPEDVDNYADQQASIGTIPPAGSEFVHSKAITRQYLGNQSSGSKGGASSSFEVNLSMVAASVVLPVSYYGSHLSSGATRAGSLVATEPVAKNFEMKQEQLKGILRDIANKFFEKVGLDPGDIDITFPEIITQDRSQKLKDLYLAETAKWIAPERSATQAVQELGFTEYDYEKEMDLIKEQADNEPLWASPLTAPPGIIAQDPAQAPTTGLTPSTDGPGQPKPTDKPSPIKGLTPSVAGAPKTSPLGNMTPRKPSAVTGLDKKKVKDSGGY